ncbi:hypothetical protein [Massilia horti]|uniref:Uncharacterized protein n=1 Tax=Massilia horti TaxID=2562153 RepID=A0A4Y9STB9_9BURK|nr:hypothetical protein [Massilia horti]TFW28579.1 hypothetical protein E4O92_20875 [Massilia horti]
MAYDGAMSDIYKAHQTGQEKYTYFLLAAAGAAIGFAVQKTEGLRFSWWLLPVGLATICWAASFYAGCQNLLWVQSTMFGNMALLQLQNGTHPEQPPGGDYLNAAIEGTRQALHGNAGTAQSYGKWQFRYLVLGSVLFIAWRVAEMARIS